VQKDALTATGLGTFRRCKRQYYYSRELLLRRARIATPLRVGKLYHKGHDEHAKGVSEQDILDALWAEYESPPPSFMSPHEWHVERETLAQLLIGHWWRYDKDDFRVVESELPFELPLVNPDTGAPSRSFVFSGRLDGIVVLPDERLAVLEYKTTSEDIAPDSDYWLRLRCDAQISGYYLAARAMGYDVQTVIYDVTRKPSIRPRNIPVLDEDGKKIVLDGDGERVRRVHLKKDGTPGAKHGEPIQSANKEKGWSLVTRLETATEYGERLLKDIGDRPDFYYARREVPRLDDEIAEFQVELWQQSKELLDSRRADRWFRNVGMFTCRNCEFAELCLNGVSLDSETIPSGYVRLDDPNPELADEEGAAA